MKTVGRTAWRWMRLLAVLLAALFMTAVALVLEACGSGTRRPKSVQDAGRDASAGIDAGTDAGQPDAGPDAGPPDAAKPDAGDPVHDADLPDVPLE